jgi:hypothetical protein
LCFGPASIQHASTKQLKAGAAIHLSLEKLEPIDMALDDAVTVGDQQCCVYCIIVVAEIYPNRRISGTPLAHRFTQSMEEPYY